MSTPAVRDRRGRVVALGEALGAGGEGAVYATLDRADRCAKIFLPDKAATRAGKIEAMLARRPPWLLRRAIAWPSEALFSAADGAFAGFVMPARRGMIELHRLLVPDERMAIAGYLTLRDLCLVAAQLANIVAGIHRAGHVVGDLKPQNILVDPRSGRVAIIDADSFQIRDPKAGSTHRSVVITPEYAAPELWGKDLAAVDRAPASDDFALAVLIHQILLGGAHPFEGEGVPGAAPSAERIPGRIRRGLTSIVEGCGMRPAPGAIPFTTLPAELRDLLAATFGEGHASPSHRPTAATWHDALARAAGAMVRCRASRAHLHDRALAACPWCARRARTGIDLFPKDQRWQRALARFADPIAAPESLRIAWLARHVEGRLDGGRVTAAERAWLEKTGAALGFGRARVARAIDEAAAARPRPLVDRGRLLVSMLPRAVPRRRVLIALSSVAAAGVVATIAIASPIALAPSSAGEPRPVCAALAQQATIGNTRGRGAHLRVAPSIAANKIPLSEGTIVHLTGRTATADDLAWTEVEALGRSGWVASRYLVEPR